MTPQSTILIIAPIKMDREAELRDLLASMNESPGLVNPENSLVPFAHFDTLHFARFVILQDQTLDDIHTAYGLPRVEYAPDLTFWADFDGSADDFRAELARKAGSGLDRIFSCCHGYTPGIHLERWMKDHDNPPATAYVNWRGRTLTQIREEEALHAALKAYLRSSKNVFVGTTPRDIHTRLKEFAESEVGTGRLRLRDPEPTPWRWWLRNTVHLIGVPLVLLLILPLLIPYLPIFAYQLRRREKQDIEIAPRVDSFHETRLAELEDFDVTNQFTAMGTLKPGVFRRWTLAFLLWVLDWTTLHIFNRGHLARVSTIHFARWTFLNGKRRLAFASNYDGSLQSYMDDFINKVGWGLNLVFSNGIGYPTTRWLVLDGAKDEQRFKSFIRRHQLPTEVWYKAYPGLTAFDLRRNTLIRRGIQKSSMTDEELRQWLRLF